MSNLNVSNRTPSLTSVQAAPKPAAPTASAPVAKSAATTASAAPPQAAGEAQQTESQIQQKSPRDIRRQKNLMKAELKKGIMADLPNAGHKATDGLSPMERSDQAMRGLRDRLRPQETESPVDKKGNLNKQSTALQTMLMRYNPHASKAAKKESEIFRAYAETEFSSENTRFIDESIKLSKMKAGSAEFDSHLEQVYQQFVPDESKYALNLPYSKRTDCIAKHAAFTEAQTNYGQNSTPDNAAKLFRARADMVDAMSENVKEISQLMNDTWGRYSSGSSKFREDVIQGNNNFSVFNLSRHRMADEMRAEASQKGEILTDREVNSKMRHRINQKNKHGKIYQEYMNTLKDPEWRARNEKIKTRRELITTQQEQASGAHRRSVKFGLYATFIAPWKRWG